MSLQPTGMVFCKDSNIILKYSIIGNCFGFKKHVCSRDFTLTTGRNNSLPFIGWKDRVPGCPKRTCKEMSELIYETLHEMVRKQTMATRNQRENLQQIIREQTCK